MDRKDAFIRDDFLAVGKKKPADKTVMDIQAFLDRNITAHFDGQVFKSVAKGPNKRVAAILYSRYSIVEPDGNTRMVRERNLVWPCAITQAAHGQRRLQRLVGCQAV